MEVDNLLQSPAIAALLMDISDERDTAAEMSKSRNTTFAASMKHLGKMVRAGILRRHRKKGRERQYSINVEALAGLFSHVIEQAVQRFETTATGVSEEAADVRACAEQLRKDLKALEDKKEGLGNLLEAFLSYQVPGKTLREYLLAFPDEALELYPELMSAFLQITETEYPEAMEKAKALSRMAKESAILANQIGVTLARMEKDVQQMRRPQARLSASTP